ncbi:E3 ubiquitin-protein ligase RNF185-like [Olea europaea var. sylvestris]|uniref:E3 ubiquitin-protein ligase RNF185-like n=1 Tax=Olea europaea var. sylvestris TaxID=158386 RepID=UPI000C1D766C|nr:E3 ubiquitin-protein ligase RNF185-like [Olea europaea var. sylvestris]
MSIEAQESLGIGSDDGGDFECNICFELATDPIITVCGHLYCWPCLYKWLRLYSRSQGCPVCKALIREEKLIPLYGRGKVPTDPRSKPVLGVEIPNRPIGQRSETAPSLGASNISNLMFGFIPTFSPNFNAQVHGFSNAGEYGATQGYHHRYSRPFRDPEGEIPDRESNNVQETDGILKRIHFVVLVLALFALLLL